MPKDVFVTRGAQSPQRVAEAPKRPFEFGPLHEDTNGVVTFESKNKSYRIQLNTPRERFDQLTGQKVKDENKTIVFKHGLYDAKTPEEVQAIVRSKYFGPPHQANVWRRTERQKLEVKNAVRDLGVQLKERPDLMAEVAALLKTLPGGGSLFPLPDRMAPVEPQAVESAQELSEL